MSDQQDQSPDETQQVPAAGEPPTAPPTGPPSAPPDAPPTEPVATTPPEATEVVPPTAQQPAVDPGGGGDGPEPGWHPDPYGRHEYRYWDGSEWTDQVSDAGQVSSDPPTGDLPPGSGAPSNGGGGGAGKILLVLLGLAVAAGVAVLLILLLGGDDDGGGGTGTFAEEISDEGQVNVRTVDLEAGEALRIKAEPEDDDLDPVVAFAIDPADAGEGVGSLLEVSDNPDAVLSDFSTLYSDDVTDASDLSEGLEDASDDFEEQVSLFSDELSDAVEEAGIPLGTTDDSDEGDQEGNIFVAPFASEYRVLVTGGDDTTGEYELTVETEDAPDDFDSDTFDPDDEVDFDDYFELYFEHQDFFCDEDFFSEDVISDESTQQFCDADDFEEFTDDISDQFTDFSDFSTDFSTDFSSDFTGDFTSDFTTDAEPCDLAISGDPISPGDRIDGSVSGAGDFEAFELAGDGSVVDIAATQTDNSFDPIVTVCDSSGFEIERDDDGGGFPNARISDFSATSGGDFLIVVTGFGDSSGDFELAVG